MGWEGDGRGMGGVEVAGQVRSQITLTCMYSHQPNFLREGGGNKHTLIWSCNFTRCSDVSLDQVCNHSIKVVFIGNGCGL